MLTKHKKMHIRFGFPVERTDSGGSVGSIHSAAKALFICLLKSLKIRTPPGVSFGFPVEKVISLSSGGSLKDVAYY